MAAEPTGEAARRLFASSWLILERLIYRWYQWGQDNMNSGARSEIVRTVESWNTICWWCMWARSKIWVGGSQIMLGHTCSLESWCLRILVAWRLPAAAGLQSELVALTSKWAEEKLIIQKTPKTKFFTSLVRVLTRIYVQARNRHVCTGAGHGPHHFCRHIFASFCLVANFFYCEKYTPYIH